MHIDSNVVTRDRTTTVAPSSNSFDRPSSLVATRFSGASAQARVDTYERVLKQSLQSDFSLPTKRLTTSSTSSTSRSRYPTYANLVLQFIDSVRHTFASGPGIANAKHSTSSHGTESVESPPSRLKYLRVLFNSIRDTFFSATAVTAPSHAVILDSDDVFIEPVKSERSFVLPTTFSGVLKSFRGCDRPFTDLVSLLTDRDDRAEHARQRLAKVATILDETANLETKNGIRAEVCRLMVDVGKSIDGEPVNLQAHIENLISQQFNALRAVPDAVVGDSETGINIQEKRQLVAPSSGIDSDPAVNAARVPGGSAGTEYDFYHWKTQEADIERISLDDNDAGKPLFFELNYQEYVSNDLASGDDSSPSHRHCALPLQNTDSASSQVSSSSEIGTPGDPPHPQHPTLINGAVVALHTDTQGVLRWEPISMTLYEGPRPPGRLAQQWIEIDNVKHLQIERKLYPVLEATPGHLWIYSRQHLDLPFIPLVYEHGAWRVKQPPVIAAAEPPLSSSENPIHYAFGEKYIRAGTTKQLVDRTPIIGEENMDTFVTALKESGPLSGPDAQGFLLASHGRLLIEGKNGYYAVEAYDPFSGDVLIEGMSDTTSLVLRYNRATKQWRVVERSVSHQTTNVQVSTERLTRYRKLLPHYPFLSDRQGLLAALKNLFTAMQEWNIKGINRAASRHTSPSESERLFAARSIVNRRLQKIAHWDTLSPIKKQIADSAAQASLFVLYEPDQQHVGMCGEYAALAFHFLPSKMKKAAQAIRLSFFERSTGRTHEAVLLGGHSSVIIDFWGDLTRSEADLPSCSRTAFAEYLFERRDHLFAIDMWGSRQLIDFSLSISPEDALSEIVVNLQEAGFGKGLTDDFVVSASVPRRLPKQ